MQRKGSIVAERLEVLPRVLRASHCLRVVHLQEAIERKPTTLGGFKEAELLQLVLVKALAIIARARERLELVDGECAISVHVKACKRLLKDSLQRVRELTGVEKRRLFFLRPALLLARRHSGRGSERAGRSTLWTMGAVVVPWPASLL